MTSYVILKDANAGRRRSWFESRQRVSGVPSPGGMSTMSGDMPPEPEVSVGGPGTARPAGSGS